MKRLFIITAASVLCSCSDAFVNHTIAVEKKGDCNAFVPGIRMVSNINGERYTFDCCMDDNFDKKDLVVDRKGDTINVSFPNTGAKQSLFTVTLDIDAKPPYHLINIDGRPVQVREAEK